MRRHEQAELLPLHLKGTPTRKIDYERVYMVVSHSPHPMQMASCNAQGQSSKQTIKTS